MNPNTQTPTPNAAPMNTTTQHEVEPTPAYAFSIFAKTRPALQEIAAITGKTFEEKKGLGFMTDWSLKMALDKVPKPRANDDYRFVATRTAPLKEQLRNPDLSNEEAEKIQRRIIEISEAPLQRFRDHQKNIERLSAAVDSELEAFEEWIANDPEGIAAAAQDGAHDKWIEAERAREAAEAKEAEIQARIEEIRAERKQEAYALGYEIGGALFETDPDHPDIDGQTMQEFLEFAHELWPRLNAILTGPPGVGKSRALAAAAVAECQRSGREDVEWITGYEFAELVSNLSTDKREEANARLKAITEASILYFDDLGSANFTTARTSRFFRLIDERYRRKLLTFMSTNYSTPQLKKIFTATGDSKDEAVRILRRIIGTPAEPLARFFHFKRPQEAMR